MIMGTNDSDFLNFQGEIGQLTVFLVNPYSSEEIYIDEEKNINTEIYDGLDGTDLLSFTNFGDAIFISNALHQQVVKNIEFFIAGDGGDVIVLAHETFVTGDLIIFGGQGNDILWSNSGNDQIVGAGGDDIIDSGPGDDGIHGENDNDSLNGGEGNDYIIGGDGNDVLFGGNRVAPIVLDKEFSDNVTFPHLMEGVNIVNLVPPGTPALGIANNNLSVDFQATATLTFREGFAGYNNTLGIYHIAADGTIDSTRILWANTKTAQLDVPHEILLPVGEDGGQFGFFIIADGYDVNNHYTGLNVTDNGNLNFIYDYGLVTQRLATVNDDASHIKLVYNDGVKVKVLKGEDYHTTERGGDSDINADHQHHTVSGLVDVGQHDVLRIGFEDLPNLGDADYEDVLFDLNIMEQVTEGDSEDGNDTLEGNAGDDTLYGQDGDDILMVGEGVDDIYGGRGDDIIFYDFLDGLVDTIHEFEMGADNDVLNISNILEGYDPLENLLSDFVEVQALNGDTHIRVNADGDHGGVYTAIAIIAGVETTLAGLTAHGNLVADQHVIV